MGRMIAVIAVLFSVGQASAESGSCYVHEMGRKGVFSYNVDLVRDGQFYKTQNAQKTMNFKNTWTAVIGGDELQSRITYYFASGDENLPLAIAKSNDRSVYLHTDLSAYESTHRLSERAYITIDCRAYFSK